MIAKQILVADDSPIIRDFIQILLSAEGHKIDEARDGLQAVAQIKVKAYDLILSDIQMPHLDGMHVLAEARRLQPQARVILMSGMGADPAKIRELGAFDFISKPFSFELLIKKVGRSLKTLEPKIYEPILPE